ncbi:translation initiation factor IF-1 [endosymbiont GvMRE of Glomus versiforme]|uniref:translation initiation factor IF-1 n=1 Tax=endosymbiont GvMRE of Glomus versiforme TaxID=2039283 RepID=UPI000ECECB48|nr:translation initiation factor IF-1 [endosymbiont GvMRE of Glomus versiforme]RHZ36324.1 hypothetical protein GvMRE_Ic1g2 [endosymbiont GvMRE of Glomus versiforme]
MMSKKTIFLEEEGKIVKKYNVNSFQVQLTKNNLLVTADIANRLKSKDKRWKKIMEGDKVLVEIPLGDLKGRIIGLLS